jgi:hypothetical protein
MTVYAIITKEDFTITPPIFANFVLILFYGLIFGELNEFKMRFVMNCVAVMIYSFYLL